MGQHEEDVRHRRAQSEADEREGLRRWSDTGKILQHRAPDAFRDMLAFLEVWAVMLPLIGTDAIDTLYF